MSPIDFGGGMIFPSSYGRDQFSPAEEAQMEHEQALDEGQDPRRPATWMWLSAAIYRTIADPYDSANVHRNIVKGTFEDTASEEDIDRIIDALIEYGAIRETADGDLEMTPYEETD